MNGREVSEHFESEVRRVARLIFSDNQGYSGEIHEGRERDGYFDDGETVHIIEVTRNTAKSKAEGDLDKSVELKKNLQRECPDKNYKIWFITEKEPTADQAGLREIYRKKARCPVVIMSFRSFEQKLVDAPHYLSCRNDYKFGSVRNLVSEDQYFPMERDVFVPLQVTDQATCRSFSTSELADIITSENAGACLLLGPYGSGKSMTLREVFFELKGRYDSRRITKFPLHLNLRDHVGQSNPASAIYDHAVQIGFGQGDKLVRAWRAGQVHVLLDGFDEIASSRFRGGVEGMRLVRKNAMTLVRNFVQEHPLQRSGVIISGRQNYFGSEGECLDSLGLRGRKCNILTLSEFDEEQLFQYLKKVGIDPKFIPEWIPSRPLLVGYLAHKKILDKALGGLSDVSAAEGWDYLLDMIAEREGEQLEELGGSREDLRKYIERLASRARCTVDGRGPLSLQEMVDTLKEVLPTVPDETAQQLLLRMAGLTSTSTDDDDSREFVDDDLVDAARAGDVVRFIENNYDEDLVCLFRDGDLMAVGGDICKSIVEKKTQDSSSGKLLASLVTVSDKIGSASLCNDIYGVMLLRKTGVVSEAGDMSRAVIKDGYLKEVEVDLDLDCSSLTFSQCLIQVLEIGGSGPFSNAPSFHACHIERVSSGGLSWDQVKSMLGEDTDFGEVVDDGETVSGLRKLDLQDGLKVLLTVLRKLYIQAGKGRKESAFFRGLGAKEKAYVPDVLKLLAKHEFSHKYTAGQRDVWMPNRAKKEDVMSILGAPEQSNHPLVNDVKEL
ncbi:NACHT domain-containing protein [Litchfieldella rifensis]|uniref:NACHT domain-containing protein n=1 Tax=Litchfieldella rifensis TaxID=762643 RepID=A0ABV7LTW7_9GAMM